MRTTRDRRNRLLSRTDALGGQTLFAYDGADRLVSVTRPDGSVQRAAYDTQGQLVELTLPGGARWRQEFDERGCAAVSPIRRAARRATPTTSTAIRRRSPIRWAR